MCIGGTSLGWVRSHLSAPLSPDAAPTQQQPSSFRNSACALVFAIHITTELWACSRGYTFATAAMAKKAKARLIHVRLISMAMTGFFYTFKRPRTAPMMGMMKYDPIVRKKVLFLESKKRSK
ncbi:uncharacterized protein HRG_07723 [Hirsutella rhossiliensis]|uniref:Large ribosomal subunit protein bL33m n=1 Tax=Hirsutella rhossiliensis TaxID=111463 RepID=A0A9P8MUU4_9HYPO|nr:uncharacterized protein HRG_07723 [Hirsutella rhossiliensis]KAH0961645.1 hypothetical protein HRG_07723 [Hirsutella rhossiliensis]